MRVFRVSLFIMVIFFSSACNSVLKVEELKKDLIGKTVSFSGTDCKISSIEEIKIIKRLTDKNRRIDEIYVDMIFIDGNNRKWRFKECPIIYRLYNDGWRFARFGDINPGAVISFESTVLLPEIKRSFKKEKLLTVYIKQDGSVYFKKQLVDDLKKLPILLKDEIKRTRHQEIEPKILIRASPKVSYKKVVELMDAVRSANIEIYGLVTE